MIIYCLSKNWRSVCNVQYTQISWRINLITITKFLFIFEPSMFVFKHFQYLFEGMVISLSLTHWGRVTHICVSKIIIIGSDNGLSPDRRQAIIWTNAGILLIGPWGTNFSEISIGIQTFSFKKMHVKMSSAKWRPFCLGLNMLSFSSLHFR